MLPDGTEISSGAGTVNAIKSTTITECVNSGQELTLGSCCCNMVEAKLIAPEGELIIEAGTEISVYKIDDLNQRHAIGIFITEKPTRSSAHTLSVTAYDRVSLLDKDLTTWLAGLTEWPYSLYGFAQMVCQACGLTLKNTELPNGSYQIQPFSGEGITGRQLMQWVGEAAGRFCRATADGEIEFAWYTPISRLRIGPSEQRIVEDLDVTYSDGNISITLEEAEITETEDGISIVSEFIEASDDGNGNLTLTGPAAHQLYFYQNGLSFEDYQVAQIEKVQIRGSEEDVGAIYPDEIEAVNAYHITANLLLTTATTEPLKAVAQTLYEQLATVAYTPCKVTIPATLDIHAGHIVQITDRNGKQITAYVMTKKQAGQKDTLECTGSPRRGSASTVNNQSYNALLGKVLNLRLEVEGVKVENADTAGNVAKLSLDIENIGTEVVGQRADLDGVKTDLSSIRQNAQQVNVQLQNIRENGVDKVTTSTNYTFDASGLRIAKDGEEMENKLDNTGMYVTRSGEPILQANDSGVVATDVKVRNYLIIGENARFEDYSDGSSKKRTACFFVGG